MKKTKKILIIIQRSNGDVCLSNSLIKALYIKYQASIDLLVNEDTISIAKLLPHISNIFTFSYQKKRKNKWVQEKEIILKIFKKYDLSICLTASDRSVLYALLASKNSISAVETNNKKSWWKKLLLSRYYFFDDTRHILTNNLKALELLKIDFDHYLYPIEPSMEIIDRIKRILKIKSINNFVIFHPSAQYEYKVYSARLRDILLSKLNNLGISIIVTGGSSLIDLEIKKSLKDLKNIHNFIGETSIEEFIALSKLSMGYIGMDTLNMHIAASQNKYIFAIFGPTNLKMWSPWSNDLMISATENKPIQKYGKVTIFQANMQCVACGKEGCNDSGVSLCLDNIPPEFIFNYISEWYEDFYKHLNSRM